jgi:hypothetical protein
VCISILIVYYCMLERAYSIYTPRVFHGYISSKI